MPPRLKLRNHSDVPQKPALTKAGEPASGLPAQAVKPSGTIRVVAYVKPETYDWIDAVQIEQGCTMGQALDIIRASAK